MLQILDVMCSLNHVFVVRGEHHSLVFSDFMGNDELSTLQFVTNAFVDRREEVRVIQNQQLGVKNLRFPLADLLLSEREDFAQLLL